MSNKIRQALCCTCGESRTCRRPRNHQHENYWLSGPVDRNWHRELGDLKCDQCGQVTRHAILHRDGDNFRDHAERITRIALGGNDPIDNDTVEKIRRKYRQGRQSNPFLHHMWSGRDEDAAREAGKATVMSYCGEVVEIPEMSCSRAGTELLQPDPVRWDQEYEDPDTGGWWVEMDCPDCYRVVNERRLAKRRKLLNALLILALRRSEEIPGGRVNALIEAFEAAMDGVS